MANARLNSPFHDLWQETLNKGLAPGKEQAARDWMRSQWKTLEIGADPLEFLKGETRDLKRKRMYVGFMYQFLYDAKNKDDAKKLPYWDRYPLMFPLEDQGDRILGLNLHYLNRPQRARLMDALYTLATNKKYNDNQKLALSYGILVSAAKFKAFKPCIKTYLKAHIKSRLYKIPSEYWDLALWAPTERFVRKPKTYVWAQSSKMISGR